MTRIEQTKGGLLNDSCQWVLNHHDFQQWRDDEHSRLLWVKGDPGKGKTMLLIGIIKELSRRCQQLAPDAGLLSFFFCQATDDQLNTASVVLRGLIYLLLVQQPLLISRVRKKYDYAGRPLFEDGNSFYYFSEILRDMLHDPCLSGAYVIVDALDECESRLPQLLDFIVHNAATSQNVKWIVSSRNRPDIEQYLGLVNTRIRLSLELNASQVSHAVDMYIEYKVSRLASIQHNEVLQVGVRNRMCQMANGTFLWVALVFKELQNVPSWDILPVLDEMPADLVQLYDRMIQQIQSLKRRDPELCQLVLSTATLAYRPLHLLELGILSSLPGHIPANTGSVTDIVKMCGSFLTIRKDYVYFIHQSAKDYLINPPHSAIFPSGCGAIHHDVFSRSLQVMSKTLQRDIYNLRDPGILIDEVKPKLPDPLDPLRYAGVYWIEHLCEVDSSSSRYHDELRDGSFAYKFIQNIFLYWLEALSLMRSMSNGVLAIIKLEALLRVQSNESHFLKLIQDARRFILFNRWIIENAPLQAYVSALVFSPTKSLIRELFKKEEPGWITTNLITESSWSPCLQTLHGHTAWVESVTFSPDSRQLASASSDQTVCLWDAQTGALYNTLKGHSQAVFAVGFSRNSELIASVSDDRTIRLWDTQTGALQSTLKGHSEKVTAVAFSPDSQRLVATSKDQKVRLWDTQTGALQSTLEGHSQALFAVGFLPNSELIALASRDRKIRLWDTQTGAVRSTLEGHSESHFAIALSPNSELIASISRDMTIQLWDTQTGTLQSTLESRSERVIAVAFSPNNELIASVSNDTTVRLWDTQTGAVRSTLKGHSRAVTAVAFSPNSELVASASDDTTVRLWDTQTGAVRSTLKGHSEGVIAVAFSPNSQLVASASSDKTVRLWDVKISVLEQTHDDYSIKINTLAVSSDGRRFASASSDCMVRLWDADKGLVEGIYPVGKIVTSMFFNIARSCLTISGGPDIELAPLPFRPSLIRGKSLYRLAEDRSWITWKHHKVLWLPTEYRPSCSIFKDNVLFLGTNSGRVIIIRFDHSINLW